MTLAIEVDEKTERHLQSAAERAGLTAVEYVARTLNEKISSEEERDARHRAAVQRLMTFGEDHNITLGPDLTIKQLIEEGRRY